MTTEKHKKHPNISRPNWGKYGRNEIGVLGAPCGVIDSWVSKVIEFLPDDYQITYFDADHKGSPIRSFGKLTDHMSHHLERSQMHLNDFDLKLKLRDQDMVVVNSNHFHSERQVVFCTNKKQESLSRKLDRLIDVGLVILEEGMSAPFDFLFPYIKDHTPVLSVTDYKSAAQYFGSIVYSFSTVKGLILAGGKSFRMGQDKGQLDYHGESQVDFLINQFSQLGLESLVSCRADQENIYQNYSLPDVFLNMGPYGAILSAFKKEPDTAWLVCACDIPLLTMHHLSLLMERRNPSKLATCFYNPQTGWPEPLITLWEPRAYSRMLDFMTLGYNCPRKVLINSHIEMVAVEDASFMDNANTPEDYSRIKNTL